VFTEIDKMIKYLKGISSLLKFKQLYYTFKKDMLVKYYNNEISFDLVEFKNSRYSNIQLPNREKIIVNMQVDDEDFECLLDVCSNNGIGIDELKNATFPDFITFSKS